MDDAKGLLKQQGILLIEDYDRKARDWGWEADQGYDAKKVTRSRGNWLKAKKKLTEYVQDLERNNAVLAKDQANLRATVHEYEARTGDKASQITGLAERNAGLIKQLAEQDRKIMELTGKLRNSEPLAKLARDLEG
jgi:predicted RNase H-like nuclease (RuvC/YqgF family)